MNSNNIEQSVVKLETPLSFGSVCSGIEAASVAWEPLGWRASWFAEIEPFPSAVLAYHWPQFTNLGDMTKIRERVSSGGVSAPDVLVGGTPCQAFSVAGARKSLSDDRGQLTLEYVRLLNEVDAARRVAIGKTNRNKYCEQYCKYVILRHCTKRCFLLSGETRESASRAQTAAN